MSLRGSSSGVLAASAAFALAAVGAALLSQHVFGMQPCAWCVLQRLVYLAIAVAALLGLVWQASSGRRVAGSLQLLLAAGGAAAALWQHVVAASSVSCDLTLADRIVGALGLDAALPSVFMALASCAEANVPLLGVPYSLWSLAGFVLLGAAAVLVLRRPG